MLACNVWRKDANLCEYFKSVLISDSSCNIIGANWQKSKNLKGATWDLQHLLIFAESFKNSALTGGKMVLADYRMVSL